MKSNPQRRSRRARNSSHVQEELESLRRFHILTADLTCETELRSLAGRVLAAAIEITETDFGHLQLADPFTGDLEIVVYYGFQQDFVDYFNALNSGGSGGSGGSACAAAFTRRSRVIAKDVKNSPLYDIKAREVMLRAGALACQSTPLLGPSGEIIGVLTTHYRVACEPSPRSLHFLDLLARQAADLIGRIVRREQLESLVDDRTRELREKNVALSKQAGLVHELSGRLLRAQDAERRRIARELHDTTGQEIGLISMNLGVLSKKLGKQDIDAPELLTESANAARRALEQLRTLSYLLHPPLLDDFGFRSAVLWYVEGFEKRSGIRVQVEICESTARLSSDIETAFFRVVQEALTNIHRYSGSDTARIALTVDARQYLLVIEDRGKGMPASSAKESSVAGLGVGIPGMRERLRQLGGSLEIQSSPEGTRILASVPSTVGHPGAGPAIEESVISAPSVPVPAPSCAVRVNATKYRLLVVDDHELIRTGVRAMLQAETDLEICGEASTGPEAITKAMELQPDLIILDLTLPEVGGHVVSGRLRKQGLASKILILTVHSGDFLAHAAQRSGFCEGYVQKATASQDLVHAIRLVLNGETFFPAATKTSAARAGR